MSYRITKHSIPLFESYCRKNDIDGREISAKISGVHIILKVAATIESQEKGYMNTEEEPLHNRGIIFVYDDDQPLSFWMKNVKFPLDIIFFDSEMKYIDHKTMEPGHEVDDHNLPQYHSKKPARFAIELQSGWCEKNMTQDCKLSF